MKLSSQTMETFAAPARADFQRRAIAHLRRFHPEWTAMMDDRSIRRFIERGVSQAAQYDFELEPDLIGFLDLLLELRPNFDTSRKTRWAGRILRNPKLSPAEKVELIEARLEEVPGVEDSLPSLTNG